MSRIVCLYCFLRMENNACCELFSKYSKQGECEMKQMKSFVLLVGIMLVVAFALAACAGAPGAAGVKLLY